MIFALIPAAGSGSRIGAAQPKQYLRIGGKSLLAHTVAAFEASESIDRIAIVIAADDERFDEAGLGPPGRSKVRAYRVGGASRHESVLNGLRALATEADDEDWVLVHDAARPGIDRALIERLIAEIGDDPVGGLLALPLADTLKRAAAAGVSSTVVETLPREGLWLAQTPQMFRYRLLLRALESARARGIAVTDESSAVEATGAKPRLIPGNQRNFKVTYPEDLALAELILSGGTR